MNYIQVEIESFDQQQKEILIALLTEQGYEGFEEDAGSLKAFIGEENFNEILLKETLKGISFSTSIIEEKNWNEEWERNFQPIVVGNFCAIRAEFHQPIKNVEQEIIITPKMSFGTGHHATTYMMIEQMRDIDFKNKTVFDFGTGTGILAIFAEKLGASKIEAIDVDDWSIENAKENVVRNNCSKISLSLSSQIPNEQFDIILANINRNVILNYLPQLKTSLKTKSYLLLSGLLKIDEKDIIEECNIQNLKLIKNIERNNWVSLVFINES